jgi:hypothetical protein
MNDCIIPKGEVTRLGYIRLWNKGNRILAHKKAYQEVHGDVPEGYEIDHVCKNRSCANVSHLRVVSHTENMRNSDQTKLTLEKAKEILFLRGQGISMYKIAKQFDVTPQCVWRIVHKKNWKDAHFV